MAVDRWCLLGMPALPAAEEQKLFCSGASAPPRRIQGFRSSLLGVRVCSCLPHHTLSTIFQQFLAQKKAISTRHLQVPSAWNSCRSFSTVSFNPVSEPAIRSSSRGLSFHLILSRTCHSLTAWPVPIVCIRPGCRQETQQKGILGHSFSLAASKCLTCSADNPVS